MDDALLDQLSEVLQEPLVRLDVAGNVVQSSRRLARLLGVGAGSIAGAPLEQLVTDDHARVQRLLHQWGRTSSPLPGELSWRRSNGEALRMRCDGARFQGGDSPGILVRCRPRAGAVEQFTLLNDRIAALTREVRRRQQAESLASEQREWLGVVLRSIGDAVIATDLAARVIFINPVAEQLTGWSAAEAAGQRLGGIMRVIDEQTRQPAPDLAAQVLREKTTVALANHALLIDRDGGEHPIEDSAAPIRDAQGTVQGVVIVFHDVSDRRRAEAEARRQHEWFRTTLASIGDGVIATDAAGRVVFINPVAEHLTGWSAERARDRPVTEVFDIVNEQTRAIVENPVQHVLREGTVVGLANHTILRRPDGTEIPIDDSGAPIRPGPGEVDGAVLVFRDVTERRRTEQRLREREERFRRTADDAPVLIWMSDPDKACTWCNRPWLEFTGRTLEQERGGGWAEGIHPDDRDRCRSAYATAFDAREPFRMEYRMRRHDGAWRSLLEHGQPLHEGGAFIGYIGSCIDITDLVEAREALLGHQASLEEQVRQRTREVEASSERLRLAERLSALGTLSAGLGHDIGNLILPMRARLDVLRDSTPAAQQEHADAIERCLEYLKRLITGLRLLAQDPARRVGEPEQTALPIWWNDLEPVLRNLLPANIELTGTIDGSLPPVAMGRAGLAQVIFNLVQNAGQALRGRAAGHVTVSASPAGDAGVRLVVEDDGPGMSEEVRRRCFEPFFTTKTREFSTGMGLALVHGAITAAGGRIDVESEPDRGTRFILRLPAAPALPVAADGERPGAWISIADERMRALAVRTLRDAGLRAEPWEAPAAPAGSGLWVADGSVDAALVERFAKDGGLAVVTIGHPPALELTRGAQHIALEADCRPSELRGRLLEAAQQLAARGRSE